MQTASQAGAAKPGVRAAGCYKCGKKGHWARDCTAPPEEWIAKGAAPNAASPPEATQGENQPTNAPQAVTVADAARQRKKKPKVTLELLQKPGGFADLQHNFPSICAQTFKGPGHEVSDLRRLLEMYQRWAQRIFPSADFDTFIEAVEKLSGTNVVKHELQEMRMKVLKPVQDALAPPQDPPEQEQGLDRGAAAARDWDEEEQGDMMLEDEDEELLELAAMPMHPAAPGAAHPSELDLEEEEEELLQLALQADVEEAGVPAREAPAGGEAAGSGDEMDDDELLRMLEEEENGVPAREGEAAAPAEEEDDQDAELLALAMEDPVTEEAEDPAPEAAQDQRPPAVAHLDTQQVAVVAFRRAAALAETQPLESQQHSALFGSAEGEEEDALGDDA